MPTQHYKLSRHAAMRCQQRGIPTNVVWTLLEEADRAVPAGSGAYSQFVSKRRRRDLTSRGVPAWIVEKLMDVCVVTSGTSVLTVFHGYGRKARRYRRAS